MEGVWATIFICHLIFGGHLLNIPNYQENNKTKPNAFIVEQTARPACKQRTVHGTFSMNGSRKYQFCTGDS